MLDSKLEPAVMEHGIWEDDTSNDTMYYVMHYALMYYDKFKPSHKILL